MLRLTSVDGAGDPLCDPVSLNVGGELYTTTLDTLTRCRDSMLGAMFGGRIPPPRDGRGNVFIDRDGKMFRHILNYLRSGALDLPDSSAYYAELPLLRREADFFQIRPLLEEIARREASTPLSLRGGPLGALLTVRVLHFNLRRGPENHELRTCSIRVFTADLFCTWRAFVGLLCERFSYRTSRGLGSAPLPLRPSDAGQNRLKLEWVSRPEGLPRDQYDKQRYRMLAAYFPPEVAPYVDRPGDEVAEDGPGGQREIPDMQGFVEELLSLSLAEGFKVDTVTPDPKDILNCSSLRLVKG
ncbi:hypothetical protein NHX12_024648 [Muraenolepis orangiensis]|uniref:BTB domain-containing protein n=1 Tax=Muraenolepis orangiensis TaxID=630683 RepID=A0A9Q0EGE9_9TELE|nr:hypothetical protein NHX12_024648 [Muraenolepis orangiensis]